MTGAAAVRQPLDLHEVHALVVAVANHLLDEALDPAAPLAMPARYGLVLLAASVKREGARRAGVAPDGGGVLCEAVRELADMARGR